MMKYLIEILNKLPRGTAAPHTPHIPLQNPDYSINHWWYIQSFNALKTRSNMTQARTGNSIHSWSN